MVEHHPKLKEVVSDTSDTMASYKNGIKTSAMLRKLETLRPIVHNVTRWSGKYNMLARFMEVRESLITVADSNGFRVPIDRSELFSYRARIFERMLNEIAQATL